MKKILSIIMLSALMLTFAACKKTEDEGESADGAFIENGENIEDGETEEVEKDTETDEEKTEYDPADTPEEYFDFEGIYTCNGNARLVIEKKSDKVIDFTVTAVNDKGTAFATVCESVPVSMIKDGKTTVSCKDNSGSVGVLEISLIKSHKASEENTVTLTFSDTEPAEDAAYTIQDGEYTFIVADSDFELSLDGCIKIDDYLDVWATSDLSPEKGGIVMSVLEDEDGYIFEYRGFAPKVIEGAFAVRFKADAKDVFEFDGIKYLTANVEGSAASYELNLEDGEYEFAGVETPTGKMTLGFGNGILTLKSVYYTGKLTRNSRALATMGAGEFSVTDISDLVAIGDYIGEWAYLSLDDNLAAAAEVYENDGVYGVNLMVRRHGITETYEYVATESITIAGDKTYINPELSHIGTTSTNEAVLVLAGNPVIGFDGKDGLYANVTDVFGRRYTLEFVEATRLPDAFERLDENDGITEEQESSEDAFDEETASKGEVSEDNAGETAEGENETAEESGDATENDEASENDEAASDETPSEEADSEVEASDTENGGEADSEEKVVL